MISYNCDGCGKELKRGKLRYTVKIDVRAAYDEMVVSLADLVRDHRSELIALIEKMKESDTQEIEEQVYKAFELDLCPACHKRYIRDPLGFRPAKTTEKGGEEVDAFLRSLGFPQTDEGDAES